MSDIAKANLTEWLTQHGIKSVKTYLPFRKAELLQLVTKIIKNKWLKWATTCCTTCTHGEYHTVTTI
jgi:hypothetical protein